MKNLRLLHRWMGLFFSPVILFFSFSGALQTFSLHDVNRTTGYVPPTWVVVMAQIHKKQTMSVPKAKSKPTLPDPTPGDSAAGNKPAQPTQPARPALPLKIFVFAMSIGLIATTLLGIYMAFRFGEDPRIIWAMLAGGTVLPIAMMVL
jgi:hypothetical protein